MASITGVSDITPNLTPQTPADNAPDIGTTAYTFSDGIGKGTSYFSKLDSGLSEGAQAYAKSDLENTRKVVASAVKLNDKVGEFNDKVAKLKAAKAGTPTVATATPGPSAPSFGSLAGRGTLAGAGLVSGTVKGVADVQKTVKDVSNGNYGSAAVDGLQVAKDAAVVKSSADALSKTATTALNKLRGTTDATKATAKASEGVIESSSKSAINWVKGLTSSSATVKTGVEASTEVAAHATTEAVVHVGAEVGAEVAGKAAGRFIPGVNDVIAVADTAVAAKSWSDLANHKGSMSKAIGNSVTALGSIAAATNIPIVSQIGAGVSVVSSLVTGFFLK
jgi:hypothetical protein